MFKIATNLGKLPRDLQKFMARSRFAVAVGITWTGQDIKKELQAEMQAVFDRPTRFTLNSLGIKPATKRDLNGKVFFRDFAPKGVAAGRYLESQIEGGERRAKRSELHLRKHGRLKRDEFLVPGKGARLNQYGNIPRAQVTKALSDVGVQWDPGQNTKDKKKRKYFWLPKAGRRLAGIYFRQGRKTKSFMVAVRQPAYRRRLDFDGVSRKEADRKLTPNIKKAIKRYAK